MLFASQRSELIGTKHTLYFAGAAYLLDERIAFVTGARTKEEPYEIIATVEYLGENGSYQQAFSQEMEPATFEKFLNSFGMKIGNISAGQNKLKEVRHVFRTIDDDKYDLDEAGKNAALYVYLDEMLRGENWEKSLIAAKSTIKAHAVK
ncbi:hypothetical protein 0305phi8-36p042 [Bacillus phage 0305phi8-36]|uniref:hypothetical protein n=1 Tax=Bacillus phage 0305phi8-36 TaxID=458639 RepID=UPI00015A1F86|nr:hypothetical protein ST0305phi8-36p042 [Bacillus phage 0305phi8-36]ABS83603.1 hypothetical protein 0305phi8-36p042 [Bacillus phage 0305phi8-36]